MNRDAARLEVTEETDQLMEPEAQTSGVTPWLKKTIESIKAYAREKPWAFGFWMFGIGFYLGWKLKMW